VGKKESLFESIIVLNYDLRNFLGSCIGMVNNFKCEACATTGHQSIKLASALFTVTRKHGRRSSQQWVVRVLAYAGRI
jgi:hypothetical protein